MPPDPDPRDAPRTPPAAQVSDDVLISGVRAGDTAALRALMDRYDRLVRYTIFRLSKSECARDGHWLDSLANETWAGFLRSLHRKPQELPRSASAYLVTIARNKLSSALRRLPRPAAQYVEVATSEAETKETLEMIIGLENVEALRGCVDGLEPEDVRLWGALEGILDRKWTEAAAELGMSESTLRSRWKRTLERLRACLEAKTGRGFAPGDDIGDF